MMGLQREGYCSQLSSSGNINQASLRMLPMDHSLPPLAAQACGPCQSTLLISPYPKRPGGSGWWLGYCLSAYMSVAACWFHMCCQHQPTFPPAPTPAVSPFRATTESLFSGHTAWGAGSQVPDRWWNPCPLQWKQSLIGRKFPHSIPYNLFWLCGIRNVPLSNNFWLLFIFLFVISYFPSQGWDPCPLHWEHGVSTTGPPEKSADCCFLNLLFFS